MTTTVSAARVAALVGDFGRSPAYVGLAEALRVVIGDGRIGLDTRLPSERELTSVLDVSRTTVTKAYDALRDSGYAESRHGSGTYTRIPGGRRRAHDRSLLPGTGSEDVIDLTCAAPSAPPGTAEAYQQAAEQLPAYLGGPGYFPYGLPALRERIAATYAARGLPTAPEQIMVTPGALAATSIVAQALTRRGERVVVESPTYPNATEAIRHAGARLVPAHVDPEGWDLDSLDVTLRQSRPGAAYLIPDFQNPTGHLMSDEERARVAHTAQQCGTVVVADEAHQALALTPGLAESMPLPFAAHSPHAVTVGSASKSFWGGLRLGWIRASTRQMDALLQARLGLDLGAPVLEQLVLVELLDQADDILRGNRDRLRTQRDALVAAVRTDLPEWSFVRPDGGLALWCRLPHALGTDVVVEAESEGVMTAPGPVFAVEGGLDRHVRIPWTAAPGELEEAVRRLARAWQRVSTGDRPARVEGGPVLVA